MNCKLANWGSHSIAVESPPWIKLLIVLLLVTVDQIYHLASPASPPNYMYNPIKVCILNFIAQNRLGSVYKQYQQALAQTVLYIPSTKCKTFGDRLFVRAGLSLWNAFPAVIKYAQIVNSFKKQPVHLTRNRAFFMHFRMQQTHLFGHINLCLQVICIFKTVIHSIQ